MILKLSVYQHNEKLLVSNSLYGFMKEYNGLFFNYILNIKFFDKINNSRIIDFFDKNPSAYDIDIDLFIDGLYLILCNKKKLNDTQLLVDHIIFFLIYAYDKLRDNLLSKLNKIYIVLSTILKDDSKFQQICDINFEYKIYKKISEIISHEYRINICSDETKFLSIYINKKDTRFYKSSPED